MSCWRSVTWFTLPDTLICRSAVQSKCTCVTSLTGSSKGPPCNDADHQLRWGPQASTLTQHLGCTFATDANVALHQAYQGLSLVKPNQATQSGTVFVEAESCRLPAGSSCFPARLDSCLPSAQVMGNASSIPGTGVTPKHESGVTPANSYLHVFAASQLCCCPALMPVAPISQAAGSSDECMQQLAFANAVHGTALWKACKRPAHPSINIAHSEWSGTPPHLCHMQSTAKKAGIALAHSSKGRGVAHCAKATLMLSRVGTSVMCSPCSLARCSMQMKHRCTDTSACCWPLLAASMLEMTS